MHIRIKRNIFHEGAPLQIGDRLELPDGEALYYIRIGVADKSDPPKQARPKARSKASSSPASGRETRRKK